MPPRFVVNVREVIVQTALFHTGVETDLVIRPTHVTFVVQRELTDSVLQNVVCSVPKGLGLILVCDGVFSRGGSPTPFVLTRPCPPTASHVSALFWELGFVRFQS